MGRAVEVSKREAWRSRLWRYGAGQLSVAAFCRQEGVSMQSFYYWKRRLADESPALQQPAFVPVRISQTPSSMPSVEIELPNQALVRVPGEIARERLVDIIQAAGAASCISAAASSEGPRRC